MAGKSFLRQVAGAITEILGTQSSVGVGSAGDIPALDATGRLDATMMPVGIGADIKILVASEAMSAGDFVNVHNAAGVFKVRKADATSAGKAADGFVLAAVSNGANATVYFEGTNTGVTGQTPGDVFLSTIAGQATATAPSTTGNVVQRIGSAVAATEINFERGLSITLA